MSDASRIVSDHSCFDCVTAGQTVDGDFNTFHMATDCCIDGDRCTIISGCNVDYRGDFGTLRVDDSTIHGNHNTVTGLGNTITGSFNTEILAGRIRQHLGCSYDDESDTCSSGAALPTRRSTRRRRGVCFPLQSSTPEVPVTRRTSRRRSRNIPREWNEWNDEDEDCNVMYLETSVPRSVRVDPVAKPQITYPDMPAEGEPEITNDDEEDKVSCIICRERRKATVAVPCGHVYSCITCVRAMRPTQCAICRAPLEKVIPRYES